MSSMLILGFQNIISKSANDKVSGSAKYFSCIYKQKYFTFLIFSGHKVSLLSVP